jgi:hypothetical protein
MDFQRYRSENKKLMQKMGEVIENNKSDFVDMLDSADISASEYDSPEVLVEKYVDELPDNDKLKVMSAYLIEQNSASGFSGQIDNNEVYENYNVIYNYWDWDNDPENVSNVAGLVGGIIKGGIGLSSKIVEGQQKKKFGVTDTAQKQQEAKTELIKSVIAQKQAKAETEKALAEAKSKKTKYWIIGGSVIGGLAIIGTLIYFLRKK